MGVWEGGGRMSKWVRGGRKGGWGVERALGDGVGNGWGGKGKRGMLCVCGGGVILLTCSLIGLFKRGGGAATNHTLTSCREEQRNKEREEGGGQICVLMLIFWSN